MSKGFWVSVISYTLFIILPFLYLITTVQTLLTSGTKMTAQIDNQFVQPEKPTFRT